MARPRPKRSTLPDGSVVVAGKRPNSTGSAYFVASRGVWRATWIDPTTGRRRSVSRATRAEAERRAAEAVTRAAATVTRPLGADPDTTIDQVAAWWLDNVAAPEVRPPTLHAYRKDVARLSERLGDRTIVVVDEAGMADDANLARLALAVERAGSTLVLVTTPLCSHGGGKTSPTSTGSPASAGTSSSPSLRARDGTTIHSTADDLAQAIDYLQSDWGVARHQRRTSRTHPSPRSRACHRPRPRSGPVASRPGYSS